MNKKEKALYEARAAILKSIAHPTRLFIVDRLSHGEKCVAELTGMIGADMSTVSKHLAVLRNAGIIAAEKRGAQVYYILRVPCILNFFGCLESVLKTRSRDHLTLIKQ